MLECSNKFYREYLRVSTSFDHLISPLRDTRIASRRQNEWRVPSEILIWRRHFRLMRINNFITARRAIAFLPRETVLYIHQPTEFRSSKLYFILCARIKLFWTVFHNCITVMHYSLAENHESDKSIIAEGWDRK